MHCAPTMRIAIVYVAFDLADPIITLCEVIWRRTAAYGETLDVKTRCFPVSSYALVSFLSGPL